MRTSGVYTRPAVLASKKTLNFHFSPAGEAVGEGVAGHKADHAAQQGDEDVTAGGEVLAGAQQHGVLKRKGGQGGITAAEAGGECQAQVGRFDETRRGQSAEKPHKEAAAEVDEEGVPGHIRGGDSPAGADEIGGEVAQHTAQKAAAAHAEKCFE